MSARCRVVATMLTVMALLLSTVLSGASLAAPARASLMDIENSVMCVVCDEPLSVAQSPQAYQERDVIRGLIAQGETKQQIMRQLVAEYGVAVLGKPPAHGFNLTVYVLPPAIVLIGVATLVVTLPRWRRRRQAAAALASSPGVTFSPAEQQRLDEELSRFAG